MPLLRAVRLFNALEAGTLTGAQLQALLVADPARVSELSVMFGMRGQARRMTASPTSFGALLGGTSALNALVTNTVFVREVEANPLAKGLLLANPTATAKLAAARAGLDPAAHATTASVLAAVFAAPSAAAVAGAISIESVFFELLRSAPQMAAVDASASLRSSVYGAPLAGGYFGVINTVGADKYAVVQAPKEAGEHAGVLWKTSQDDSANTANNDDGLVNANAQNNAAHPLFQWARGLGIGGYTDWAPPAYNVIQAIAAKLRSGVADSTPFKAGGAQAYEAVPYWSATQHPSTTTTAWYVDFSDGSVASTYKNGSYRARAVRRIKL
ncbi:Protein of unknown function [Polaromonas sp. OV174]|uniref:Lcl domain-containing protein n=1 Tax=Polaromonas sp. OV174 TaxID=1855300 RepID=UPI0008F2E390|nr:DUF1566 domain-containing protein [Polaromonas sp. OV174]SFB96840.1 Protein of unknown function [Polaromonas sp. OV174]